MAHAVARSPSHRAGRKRRQVEGVRRQIWRRPLRCARRAIASAVGRIETSGQVIDATLHFAAGRPLERAWRLAQLCEGIDEAGTQLERALRRLDEAVGQIVLAPQTAAGAPQLLVDAARQCVETSQRLDQLTDRLVAAWAKVVEETRNRAASSEVAPGHGRSGATGSYGFSSAAGPCARHHHQALSSRVRDSGGRRAEDLSGSCSSPRLPLHSPMTAVEREKGGNP